MAEEKRNLNVLDRLRQLFHLHTILYTSECMTTFSYSYFKKSLMPKYLYVIVEQEFVRVNSTVNIVLV